MSYYPVLARTASHERVEGEDATLRIIIGWPSRQAAMAFMSDSGYVPHLKARTAGSKKPSVTRALVPLIAMTP